MHTSATASQPRPFSSWMILRYSSRDVSVFVVERMAHMHNFAQTREMLWQRLERFAAR